MSVASTNPPTGATPRGLDGFRVGAALVALTLGFGLLGPLLVPGEPFAQSLTKALQGPELAAPFGYDHLGRSRRRAAAGSTAGSR